MLITPYRRARSLTLISTEFEIARLGGDEFTALILALNRPEDALVVANRMLHLMRQPFVLNDREMRLTLSAFRAAGVHIALDDFGTGYSSLSYLKRMPLSSLKVDRSFVNGLPGDAESLAIVQAILAMASSLDVSVTAEGVETLAQAQWLKGQDCASL